MNYYNTTKHNLDKLTRLIYATVLGTTKYLQESFTMNDNTSDTIVGVERYDIDFALKELPS